MLRFISYLILFFVFFVAVIESVLAAPYFYVTGPDGIYPGNSFEFVVALNSDGSTLTGAQTILSYNTSLLDGVSIDARSSQCSFWAPADPSLGLGNSVAPYLTNDEKVVISCGFSAPGYTTSGSGGAAILSFYLTPSATASVAGITYSTTLTFSDQLFYMAGTPIAAGTAPSLSFQVAPTILQLIPTPTYTPLPNAIVFDSSSLNFVEVGSRTTGQTAVQTLPLQSQVLNQPISQIEPLESVARDDSIPPPPANLEQRPAATPIPIQPTLAPDEMKEQGEVLSLQSLRELLVPGKSKADQTVVMVNLASTLGFLLLLTLLAWRLILVSRKNKISYRHMKEVMTGELSMLESKMAGAGGEMEQEYRQQLERIKKELEST